MLARVMLLNRKGQIRVRQGYDKPYIRPMHVID